MCPADPDLSYGYGNNVVKSGSTRVLVIGVYVETYCLCKHQFRWDLIIGKRTSATSARTWFRFSAPSTVDVACSPDTLSPV